VAALHSTRDEFVPVDEIKRTMERAREPKRLWLIDAENHRFGGAEAELGRRLEEASPDRGQPSDPRHTAS
jgi:hypothetical protein